MESAPSLTVEDVKSEPETINIWELMKDLDEDNEGGSPLDSSQSAISLLLEPPSAKAAADTIKPSSPPTLCPLNLDDNGGMHMGFTGGPAPDAAWVADRRSRPRSFTSIRCVEDANAALSTTGRKSRMPLPAWREGSRGTEPIASKYSSSSLLPSEACMQSVVSASGSDWNPNNLQRALSFKYIFNQSNVNESQHTPSHTEFLAQQSRANADNSAHVCSESKSLMHDYDGIDSPQSSALRSALRSVVVPDTFQTFRHVGDLKRNAHNPMPSKVEQCDYAAGTIGSMLTDKFDKASGKTSRSMLDPEFLESFEKAMEQFSEEERNAVSSSSRGEGLRRYGHKHMNYNEGFLKTRGSADYPTSTVGSRSSNYAAANEAGKPKSVSHSKQNYSFETTHSKDGRRTSTSRRNSMDMRRASGGEKDNEDVAVVFYSTDSQTNLKVYEDCNTVRTILRSIVGVAFDERNILQYPDFEQELRSVLDAPVAVVPTLVVKGKLVVGIDSVLHLHKKGLLGPLLKEALPNGGSGLKAKAVCVCRGGKFLICSLCKGRGKVLRHSEGGLSCRQCSGTGLIKCPNCLFA